MKTKLLIGLLLASSAMFAAPRWSIGVGIGLPVAPAPVYVAPPPAYYAPAPAYVAPVPAYVPPYPGPGYSWVQGYWYFGGGHRYWRPGYWAAPRAHFYEHREWEHREWEHHGGEHRGWR